MELKKSPKADLQNKRSIFLQRGLIVALGLVVFLFSISQKEKTYADTGIVQDVIEQEIVMNTVQEQPKTPPPPAKIQVVSDMINIVKNETVVTNEFDFSSESTEDMAIEIQTSGGAEEEAVEEEAPFTIVEDMPLFQGKGLEAFRAWCLTKLQYPDDALENGIEGRVVLSFIVGKDGKVSGVKVLRGRDASLDKEAIRVITSSPAWTPGKQRGRPARVMFNMPIDFRIQ